MKILLILLILIFGTIINTYYIPIGYNYIFGYIIGVIVSSIINY